MKKGSALIVVLGLIGFSIFCGYVKEDEMGMDQVTKAITDSLRDQNSIGFISLMGIQPGIEFGPNESETAVIGVFDLPAPNLDERWWIKMMGQIKGGDLESGYFNEALLYGKDGTLIGGGPLGPPGQTDWGDGSGWVIPVSPPGSRWPPGESISGYITIHTTGAASPAAYWRNMSAIAFRLPIGETP